MKTFGVLYADPPWPHRKGGRRATRPNQTEHLPYPTMSVPDIQHTLAAFKKRAQDPHVLFLWTIDKFLHQADTIATTLGYTLHARIIWNKTNGVAPAFTLRFAHEYLLWYYNDRLPPIDPSQRGKHTTVITEHPRRHSQKPDAAYQLIEALYPNLNKLELFARNERPGWDHWGNELTPTVE